MNPNKYYQAPHVRIDHAIFFINDLHSQQVNQLFESKLKFIISPGGQHLFGTFNKLVPFEDGSYLELVSFEGGMKNLVERRNLIFKSKELQSEPFYLEPRWSIDSDTYNNNNNNNIGYLVDLCLAQSTDSSNQNIILEDYWKGNNNTFEMEVKSGQRKRAIDGQIIKWKIAVPFCKNYNKNTMNYLNYDTRPFFIQDLTDRNLRVPHEENQISHPNGVVGIEEIYYVVNNLEASTLAMKELLQATPKESSSNEGKRVIFELFEKRKIILDQFDSNNQQMQEHRDLLKGVDDSQIERFPYAISFATSDSTQFKIYSTELII